MRRAACEADGRGQGVDHVVGGGDERTLADRDERWDHERRRRKERGDVAVKRARSAVIRGRLARALRGTLDPGVLAAIDPPAFVTVAFVPVAFVTVAFVTVAFVTRRCESARAVAVRRQGSVKAEVHEGREHHAEQPHEGEAERRQLAASTCEAREARGRALPEGPHRVSMRWPLPSRKGADVPPSVR